MQHIVHREGSLWVTSLLVAGTQERLDLRLQLSRLGDCQPHFFALRAGHARLVETAESEALVSTCPARLLLIHDSFLCGGGSGRDDVYLFRNTQFIIESKLFTAS